MKLFAVVCIELGLGLNQNLPPLEGQLNRLPQPSLLEETRVCSYGLHSEN